MKTRPILSFPSIFFARFRPSPRQRHTVDGEAGAHTIFIEPLAGFETTRNNISLILETHKDKLTLLNIMEIMMLLLQHVRESPAQPKVGVSTASLRLIAPASKMSALCATIQSETFTNEVVIRSSDEAN